MNLRSNILFILVAFIGLIVLPIEYKTAVIVYIIAFVLVEVATRKFNFQYAPLVAFLKGLALGTVGAYILTKVFAANVVGSDISVANAVIFFGVVSYVETKIFTEYLGEAVGPIIASAIFAVVHLFVLYLVYGDSMSVLVMLALYFCINMVKYAMRKMPGLPYGVHYGFDLAVALG